MSYVEDIAEILYEMQWEIDRVNGRFKQPINFPKYKTPTLYFEYNHGKWGNDFFEIKERNTTLGRLYPRLENRGYFLVVRVGNECLKTASYSYSNGDELLKEGERLLKIFFPTYAIDWHHHLKGKILL